MRRLQSKKNALILRCANVYGYSRSMRFDAVINRFMFDANFTGRIQIHGNGKQFRAFIHVNVLIKALIGCLLQEVPSGTYNAVDKNLQILDIVNVLKEIYPMLEFIFINSRVKCGFHGFNMLFIVFHICRKFNIRVFFENHFA